MTKQKRSKSINLEAMRKPVAYSVVTTSALMLAGCSEEAEWYASTNECIEDTGCVDFCEAAYQKAVSEANATAPRYTSLSACEYDFGKFECDGSGSSYRPNMTGFLVPDEVDCDSRYRNGGYFGRSIFWPKGRGAFSKAKGKLVTSDGKVLGSAYKKGFKVDSAAFKSRPNTYKTLNRGGFGKTVRASSFSSKSSSGWGG